MLSDAQLYAILVIGILAVVALIVIPILYSPEEAAFGSWRIEPQGRCEANTSKCAGGGTRTTVTECIANPITGRGCLLDGKQTFETQVETSPCEVLCRSSIWELEEAGPCRNVGPAIDQSLGLRRLTYKCVPNDPTGSNFCTSQGFTDWGAGKIPAVESFSVGETLTTEEVCQLDIEPSETRGSWSLLSFNSSKDLPRDVFFDSDQYYFEEPRNQNYTPMDRCLPFEGGVPSLSILKEGTGADTIACLYQGQIKIPSNQSYVEECGTYQGVPSRSRSCRYVPEVDSTTGLLSRSFAILKVNQLPVTASRLPNVGFSQLPSLVDFREESILEPLNPVSLTTFFPGSTERNPECTPQEVTFNTAALMYIAPRSPPTEVGNVISFTAQIAVLINTGYLGWLSVNSENVATWVPMRYQVGGPGRLSTEVPVFNVTLYGISSDEKRAFVTIMTLQGSAIYVNSLQLGSGGNSQRWPISNAELNFYLRDIDEIQTRQTSPCNYLN